MSTHAPQTISWKMLPETALHTVLTDHMPILPMAIVSRTVLLNTLMTGTTLVLVPVPRLTSRTPPLLNALINVPTIPRLISK